MSKTLSLKEMTLQEKLAAMELLWDDLARCPGSVESPTWHKDILDERCQRVADAKAHFTAWETAKTEIRKKIL
jgi:Putative addiction module component